MVQSDLHFLASSFTQQGFVQSDLQVCLTFLDEQHDLPDFFASEQDLPSASAETFLSEEQALAFEEQQDFLDVSLFFTATVVALKEPSL